MTNDAPHSAPTPLSRFLGGWMRHPSPQEPEQVTDDAEAAEAADDATRTVMLETFADATRYEELFWERSHSLEAWTL